MTTEPDNSTGLVSRVCADCGAPAETTDTNCPHCGGQIRHGTSSPADVIDSGPPRRNALIVFVALVVLLVIIVLASVLARG